MAQGRPEDAKDAKDALLPEVWEICRRFSAADFPEAIERFQGKNAFLGVDFAAPFDWNGQTWRCAEAAFQSAGRQNPNDAARFVSCDGPKARKLAEQTPVRDDWDDAARIAAMEDVLTAKFAPNPELAQKLLATENAVLVAGNSKNETFGASNFTPTSAKIDSAKF